MFVLNAFYFVCFAEMIIMNGSAKTLESEIIQFVKKLPYWGKYLAEKILSGKGIVDIDIDISYSYLLEDIAINEETEKPEIVFDFKTDNIGNYKPDLQLIKLQNVEGVNALIEDQTIEFNPNLTIIYGANGSGKSGYVRLLKNVFYSKAPEEILHNIHQENGHKPVDAQFIFKSNNIDIPLDYSSKDSVEFEQFAVFDGKGLFRQLAEKNEFEFRPAGLSFFGEFTSAVNRIENKLNADIQNKKSGNTADDLSALFDGESEIKTFVHNLNTDTTIDDMKIYTPYSDDDRAELEKIKTEYDELFLASKGKDKELKNLEAIKTQLSDNKTSIETLNNYFTDEYLNKIKEEITDCINKEDIAKSEGLENFNTDKIEGIGTTEWKNFIVAAEAFAKKQKIENFVYPEKDDNCLLCQQPLSKDAVNLIANYWQFIKSEAENNARNAQKLLEKEKKAFEELTFDFFPDENTLTVWLTEKFPDELNSLKQNLSKQQILAEDIISDIQSKTANDRIKIIISTEHHTKIEMLIDESIKGLKEDEQAKQLETLQKQKSFLEHKEKFNTHFTKFDTYLNNLAWLKKAENAKFDKRRITDSEKALSDKYFNQNYADKFNDECNKLNGSFGVEINHTGSAGKSYKKLILKGLNPNEVLSEGEQKVIAIADFLAEMQISEVNRGVIFDDPVNSLDEFRKSEIAMRMVELSKNKQTIIFTHDLIFVSSLISFCSDCSVSCDCHWIENQDGNPGRIWLRNSPSYEKEYRNSNPANNHYLVAKNPDYPPEQRELSLKSGFAALRTCYEVLVINDLFKNVVQRFNERVSVDSLSSVYFDQKIIDELLDSFAQCCRYMEGHSHSDKYAYKKPTSDNLNEEIQEAVK